MSCQNRENFRVVSQTTGATWTKAETENTTETKIRTNKTNKPKIKCKPNTRETPKTEKLLTECFLQGQVTRPE